MLLEVRNIEVRYQKTAALKGVSMAVPPGGIVTIIGANGAGKTTTLRAISGLEPLTRGEIRFDDSRIDGLAPEEIVRRGIAQVPEGRRVFPDLTVEENLHTGAFLRADKAAVQGSLMEVFDHFPRLAERRRQWARSMSGGEQQMLAIGRALMSSPRMLLLDEPSMGLSPVMVQEIAKIVTDISGRGIPVVLVEQNAEMALRLAQYAYVLETGAVALEGPAADLHENAQCAGRTSAARVTCANEGTARSGTPFPAPWLEGAGAPLPACKRRAQQGRSVFCCPPIELRVSGSRTGPRQRWPIAAMRRMSRSLIATARSGRQSQASPMPVHLARPVCTKRSCRRRLTGEMSGSGIASRARTTSVVWPACQ